MEDEMNKQQMFNRQDEEVGIAENINMIHKIEF